MNFRTRHVLRLGLMFVFIVLLVTLGVLMHLPQRVLDEYGIRQTFKSPFPVSFDKIFHFGAYFLLSSIVSIWMWVGRMPMLKQGLFMIGALAAYSALEEYTQQFTNRSTDLHDWYADSLGFTLGAITIWALFHFAPRWLTVTEEKPALVSGR